MGAKEPNPVSNLSIQEMAEQMVKVTVWTNPNCVQCDATKKQFDKLGVKYEEESLLDNPTQLDIFKAQGFTSAPIVTTDTKTWSGFRLDKIKSLANYLFGENHGTK